MAERKLGHPSACGIRKQTLRSGFAIVGLILCIGASSQPASGQPVQWKPSIERPRLGWDYDGKRILGHIGYDICLWDATTGKLLNTMKGHKERIFVVQFSPDGKHALSSSWVGPGGIDVKSRDTRTILWNLATGRDRDIFKGQVAGEFSPDGRRIVTFSQRPVKLDEVWGEITLPSTGEVWQRGTHASFDAVVWDAFTGRQLVKAKLDAKTSPYRGVRSLHFSSDGRSLVRLRSGIAVLYNTSDGREIGRFDARTGMSSSRHFTSNGALAYFDPERIRLTDIKSGRAIQSVQHGLKGSFRFAWTHDGSRVAAIPRLEGETKIFDIESEKMTTGAKSGPYVQSAITSPDNGRLAIEWGGVHPERYLEPELGIYDMNTGEEIARMKLAEWGHMLGFSPDSKTLLVGGSEFVIYNSENGKKIRTLNLLDTVGSHTWKSKPRPVQEQRQTKTTDE